MVLVTVVAAFGAGCSSNKVVQGPGGTTAESSTSSTPGASTTIAPPVSEAPTTLAETTTTLAITTTTAPAPAGWAVIDSDGAAGPLAYPCCASNWYGAASPALPAPGATLADGFYRIEFAWPSEFSQPVNATVRRFEQCSVLPAGSCEDNGGVPYADDELGVDDAASFELSLVFDDQLHVVLGGFTGWDGFSAPAEPGAGALVYTHDGAPPLLFQGLVGFDDTPLDTRGSDIIGRIALVVEGGTMTINTYAGFYS